MLLHVLHVRVPSIHFSYVKYLVILCVRVRMCVAGLGLSQRRHHPLHKQVALAAHRRRRRRCGGDVAVATLTQYILFILTPRVR